MGNREQINSVLFYLTEFGGEKDKYTKNHFNSIDFREFNL